MPRLRYIGGSRYALRDGPTWEDGDVHEVGGATADRLAELDKFELVAGSGGGGYLREQPPEVQIDEGVCPWCPPDERYEGEHVGQHASSAHPDEWGAYTESDT
jgi:hypothetical protein